MNHLIEETSLNAWPALQQILYDGWILRFAKGYTRRANSVNAIYTGALEVAEKIERCEQIYRDKQQRPVYKISPFVQPPALDNHLDQAGYAREAPTSVQTLDLTALPQRSTDTVRIWEQPSAEWIQQYVRMNGVAASHVPTLEAILHNIALPTCFILLKEHDQPAACGLGVVGRPYVGLYDIVTEPAYRGQGFGRRLILNILNWAKTRAATTAYLQVMLDNAPALRLYDKLGFREIYQYWYRVKDNNT